MDIYEIRRKNLRKIVEQMNSQSELAEKIGAETSYISRVIGRNPSKNIGSRMARNIEVALSLTSGFLDKEEFVSEGESTQTTIPVYSITASMGRGRFVESEIIIKIVVVNQSTLGEMRLSGTGHGIVAVYADGESMEPTIPPKSVVFVDRHQKDLRDGVYLVRLEDMIYVKRLQRLPDHKLKVISDNPIYGTFDVDLKNGDDFEILGKVVRTWIERTF